MIVFWVILIVIAELLAIAGLLEFSDVINLFSIISSIIKLVAWIGIFSFFGIMGKWFVKLLIALGVISLLVTVVVYIKEEF